jgi:hypothetical protein
VEAVRFLWTSFCAAGQSGNLARLCGAGRRLE